MICQGGCHFGLHCLQYHFQYEHAQWWRSLAEQQAIPELFEPRTPNQNQHRQLASVKTWQLHATSILWIYVVCDKEKAQHVRTYDIQRIHNTSTYKHIWHSPIPCKSHSLVRRTLSHLTWILCSERHTLSPCVQEDGFQADNKDESEYAWIASMNTEYAWIIVLYICIISQLISFGLSNLTRFFL